MLRYNNGVVTSDSLLTQKSILLVSFGVDQFNELYVIASAAAGKIWRFNKSPIALGIEENGTTPKDYSLSQNYPNPFNPATKIKFSVPLWRGEGGRIVQLKIFDINGREVQTLINEALQPGSYEVTFNGSALNSGVYFYQLSTENFSETRKMLMIK